MYYSLRKVTRAHRVDKSLKVIKVIHNGSLAEKSNNFRKNVCYATLAFSQIFGIVD